MHNENFKTIAMMISGGDVPVMNAAIRAVIRTAQYYIWITEDTIDSKQYHLQLMFLVLIKNMENKNELNYEI